jgi:hypothetical protein
MEGGAAVATVYQHPLMGANRKIVAQSEKTAVQPATDCELQKIAADFRSSPRLTLEIE